MTWFDLQQEISATLRENVAKSRFTLLVGPLGIGKSHISPMTIAARARTAALSDREIWLLR